MKEENDFQFVSKESSNQLSDGDHVVEIEYATMTMSEPSEDWKDQTPQMEVQFRDPVTKKGIRAWYNLKGFKKFSDLTPKEQASGNFVAKGSGYAVNVKTGKRIENPDNTATAIGIVEKLGSSSGIPVGEGFKPNDLVGRTTGIHVLTNDMGNKRVAWSLKPEDVKEMV